jgi:hypothetical protein
VCWLDVCIGFPEKWAIKNPDQAALRHRLSGFAVFSCHEDIKKPYVWIGQGKWGNAPSNKLLS